MQRPCAPHLFEFFLQPHDAIADQPPVSLNLRLARPAEKPEPAALPFQMGPGPHQPAALVIQMRQFNLQRAFGRPRPRPENIQNQPGAVDDLAAPGFFQIALLHRRQLRIDDDNRNVLLVHRLALRLNLPGPEQAGRPLGAQRQNGAVHHHKLDGCGKPDRLGQPRLGRTQTVPASGAFPRQDNGGAGRRRVRLSRVQRPIPAARESKCWATAVSAPRRTTEWGRPASPC